MHNVVVTVVVSQGQSRNPEKRELEDAIASQASQIPGVIVTVVPHLYDVSAHGETVTQLKSIEGALIVHSWLYDRATHWVLDRLGICGQVGKVLLQSENDDEEEQADAEVESQESIDHVTDLQPRPNREIFCIDLRASLKPEAFVAEILRIKSIVEANESDAMSSPSSLQRLVSPTNTTSLSLDGTGRLSHSSQELPSAATWMGISSVTVVDEHPGRRWYPVIDFSRCTNCMECIDFCLFGVYGVDAAETILVEQPDNCRKGCPACSRVCPSNAIMFPQHKTPAIAGAPVDTGGLKIDLSKLFGAPERDEDPIAAAARERDEQLMLAGRKAVGNNVGIREIQPASPRPKDELDNLLDQLDSLDL